MASDLLSTLKSYLSKVADGEHTPAELATTLNTWIKESTESIKLKVEDEVQRSVTKMGFIKRAEFDDLKRELSSVRAELDAVRSSTTPSSGVRARATSKKSAVKSAPSKVKPASKKKDSSVKVTKPSKAPKAVKTVKSTKTVKTAKTTKAKG